MKIENVSTAPCFVSSVLGTAGHLPETMWCFCFAYLRFSVYGIQFPMY